MTRGLDTIRRGDWLDDGRVRGYALVLAACSIFVLAYSWWKATHGDGSDFLAFWGAARILLTHGASLAYDLDLAGQVQGSTGFDETFAFVNPPPFLFLIAPFGLLPYPLAWVAWVAVTFAFWFAASTRVLPESWRRWWPLIAAFPGGLIAASHAQNGLLTGALLVGGVALAERKPWLGGALIGALVIKPHLALLMPFWLAAGGRWKAFIAAGISATGLLLASWAAFGTDTMLAYMGSWDVSAQIMQIERDEFYLRMATLYGQVRIYFGPDIALAANGLLAAGMVVLVWRSWKRFGGDMEATGALALAATPLASPYLFNYDLAFLILPILWLLRDARRNGYRPWDRLLLSALYISPYATRAAALPLHLNLMPLASATMVWLIWNRAASLPPR